MGEISVFLVASLVQQEPPMLTSPLLNRSQAVFSQLASTPGQHAHIIHHFTKVCESLMTTSEAADEPFKKLKSPSAMQAQKLPSEGAVMVDTAAALSGNPIILSVEIRRHRLMLYTLGAIGSIVALMIVFMHGVEIRRYDASDLNEDQKKKIVDDYNSYSGNIASIFDTPLDVFVSTSAQIVLLHLMVSAMLQSEPTWTVTAVSYVFGTGIQYLIDNGFSALNVQLSPLEVVPYITDFDLQFTTQFSWSDLSTHTTNITRTYPETTTKNPVTNTVLRNPRYSACLQDQTDLRCQGVGQCLRRRSPRCCRRVWARSKGMVFEGVDRGGRSKYASHHHQQHQCQHRICCKSVRPADECFNRFRSSHLCAFCCADDASSHLLH